MSRLSIMSRLGIVFLTWRRYLEGGVRPYGVTLKQQYLLRKLAECEYLHPSEIAEMLFCDRPTATVVIDNMRKYGWVVSEKDRTDGRQRLIALTELGREKLKELQDRPKEEIDPLACFSEQEKEELDKLLKKLHGHLADCGLQPHKGEENYE